MSARREALIWSIVITLAIALGLVVVWAAIMLAFARPNLAPLYYVPAPYNQDDYSPEDVNAAYFSPLDEALEEEALREDQARDGIFTPVPFNENPTATATRGKTAQPASPEPTQTLQRPLTNTPQLIITNSSTPVSTNTQQLSLTITSTPSLVNTARPSSTPEPSNTRVTTPKPSKTPMDTLQPPNTPKPPATHKPPNTPQPPATHKPPDTPQPPATHKPPNTPKPPATHRPPNTPKPQNTPKPPKPTKAPHHPYSFIIGI